MFVGAGVRRRAASKLAEYGAAKVYVVDGDGRGLGDYLVAPQAEALGRRRRRRVAGARCWSPRTAEGKEIAGRLAVRLGSGLLTDAVDVDADGSSSTQSVFGGADGRARRR